MSTVLIALLILILAVGFFFWVVRAMLSASCPACQQEGREELIIPIIPGFRWFCPACSGAFTQSEVREQRTTGEEE